MRDPDQISNVPVPANFDNKRRAKKTAIVIIKCYLSVWATPENLSKR